MASYYDVLGVPRSASVEDIKRAYKKLSKKWHPDRNINNKEVAEDKFKEIAEAYGVLSDHEKKRNYDTVGGASANIQHDYTHFHFDTRNAHDIFQEVFGNEDPFANGFAGHPAYNAFGLNGRGSQPKQPPPIQKQLYCTLEELYTGCVKKMRVIRQKLDHDTLTAKPEEKILRIDVKPGWKPGTRITFEKTGDESPGMVAADIVFVLAEKPHETFRRHRNNLYMKKRICLRDALVGATIRVPLLNGRTLDICPGCVIYPGYTHTSPGNGMPISKKPGEAGDLVVEFDVVFPTSLTEEQKGGLARLLPRQ